MPKRDVSKIADGGGGQSPDKRRLLSRYENPFGGFGGGGDSTDNSSYDSSVVSDVNDEPATSDGVTNNVNKLGEKELADLNKHIQNSWE